MSRTPKSIFASFLFVGIGFIGTAPAQAKQDHVKPDAQFVVGLPLSAADKKHLLEDSFVVVKTVAAMPLVVRKKILAARIEAGMADAGQPYEPSDMVGPKPLPFRRLILAGTSSGYCVVYDEYGGAISGQEVSLYRLLPGQAVLAWQGSLQDQSRYLTLAQLRSAVSESKLYKNVR